MKLFNVKAGVLSGVAATLLATAPAQSQDSQWANQSFLTDYSTLKPIPGKEGKDYQYLAPNIENSVGKISKVMLDQPEIFLSPNSPYKGAQPADLAAIAGAVYSQADTALKARGYKIVDKPGPDTLYVRLGVTDLQIAKKKRGLLAYTPVGFVVDVGVKALQDFMTKYDLLDMSLQIEVQDSASQQVIAAAVLQRGKTAGANKPIPFDTLVAVTKEFGERFACRLDNGHVAAAQRIDCTDPATRKARPSVIAQQP